MERSKLLLSAMRSLWGNLTPNVRKVSVKHDHNLITIFFYYNSEASEMEKDLSEDAASEIIADFPEPYVVSCEIHTVKFPKKIQESGYLIYSRYENNVV